MPREGLSRAGPPSCSAARHFGQALRRAPVAVRHLSRSLAWQLRLWHRGLPSRFWRTVIHLGTGDSLRGPAADLRCGKPAGGL